MFQISITDRILGWPMRILTQLALILMFCAVTGLGCRKSDPAAGNATVASLPELNRALAFLTMVKGQMPQDVSALTNAVVLRGKRLPAAPPGKKLVIDRATGQVVFADQ
jgi:hypothetical protein